MAKNAHLKLIFGVISAVCAMSAILLAVGGVYYTLKLKEVTDLRNFEDYQLETTINWTEIIPYIITAIGAFGLLITVCGLCSSFASSRSCLITFNVCAAIVILGMIACGIIAILLAYNTSEDFLKNSFQSAFEEAKTKDDVRLRLSGLESDWHCCGVFGPSDYPKQNYPKSCCDAGTDCKKSINRRFGCVPVFLAHTNKVIKIGAGGCGLVALFTFISVVLSVILVRRLATKEID